MAAIYIFIVDKLSRWSVTKRKDKYKSKGKTLRDQCGHYMMPAVKIYIFFNSLFFTLPLFLKSVTYFLSESVIKVQSQAKRNKIIFHFPLFGLMLYKAKLIN